MKNFILPILVSIFIISSCSTASLRPDVVDRSSAQKAQYVIFGVIKDITKVTIEGDRSLGSAAGATIGGDMGADNNKAPVAAGIVGALIGSKVGAEIGSSMTKMEGLEILIETDAGKYISIIQEESDIKFQPGQAVQIVKSGGKSRVLPRSEKSYF